MTERRGRVSLTSAACLALAAALSLSGCTADPDAEADRQLTVLAAASLSSAFPEIAEQFEEENPDVEVRLSFGGSSGLVDQIAGGAPADVFASADQTTMARAVDEGVVTSELTLFATNVLTLITPPGNPAGVTGLDESLADTRLVVCADGVPCGTATHALAATAGVDLQPVSEESKVTDVRGKVSSGEADAGIVYRTDAIAAGETVEAVQIAGADARPNRYPLAVVEGAADPVLAQRFVDSVTAAAGGAVLERHGFGPA